jgi:hypothetical protein
MTVGPFSRTAVRIAVLNTERHCSGLTTRAIERHSIEEFVRIELFQRERVQDAGFDVARNCDDRRAFLARIHQAVKQMNHARTGGSADCRRIARQVSVSNSGENSIFFVTDVDEIDPAVSAKCVDKRVECVSDNPIAAFDAGVGKHLTQDICDFYRHHNLLIRNKFRISTGSETKCTAAAKHLATRKR